MSLKLCEGCKGACCRGIEEQVKRPRTKLEKTNIRWQLHFKYINYFIRNKRWYQLLQTDCSYLDKNSFCTIYESRPSICRDHKPPDCERYYPIYDELLSSPDDFDNWLIKRGERVVNNR
ncbi:MAG: YkgJ family cysteine cluster protein [Nitrospinota bacterium]